MYTTTAVVDTTVQKPFFTPGFGPIDALVTVAALLMAVVAALLVKRNSKK